MNSIIWKLTSQNIFRNGFLSITTVFTTLMVSFFLFVLAGLGSALDQGVVDLQENVDVTVFLEKSISTDNTLLLDMKKRLSSEGVSVTILSSQEALARLQETSSIPELIQDTVSFIESYEGDDVLQPVMIVSDLGSVSPDRVSDIIRDPIYTPLIDFSYFDEQLLRVSNFAGVTSITKWVFFGFSVLFLITVLLILQNTMRLLLINRSKELEIMELVGAPPQVIMHPFYIEMAILVLAGVLLSYLFLFLLFGQLQLFFGGSADGSLLPSFVQMLWGYISSYGLIELFKMLALFLVVALLSVWFAFKRYLPSIAHVD